MLSYASPSSSSPSSPPLGSADRRRGHQHRWILLVIFLILAVVDAARQAPHPQTGSAIHAKQPAARRAFDARA